MSKGEEHPQSWHVYLHTPEDVWVKEECCHEAGDRNLCCDPMEDDSMDSDMASEEVFDMDNFLITRETPESSNPDCDSCHAETGASSLEPEEDPDVSLDPADALAELLPPIKVEDSQERCITGQGSEPLQLIQHEYKWASGVLNLRLDTRSVVREWSDCCGGNIPARDLEGEACSTADQLDFSAYMQKLVQPCPSQQMRVQPMIPTPPSCDSLQWGDQAGVVEGMAHLLGPSVSMPHSADPERQCRALSLERYREKKRNRAFSKTIRYEMRKLNAERRPRVKGRFVKRSSDILPLMGLVKRPTENILPSECFQVEDDLSLYQFDFMPEC